MYRIREVAQSFGGQLVTRYEVVQMAPNGVSVLALVGIPETLTEAEARMAQLQAVQG